MYKIGSYVVYRKEVCKVLEINKNFYRNMDYYRLIPVNDDSLKLDVPVNSKCIRDVINTNKVEEIINNIPNIDIIKGNDKYIENDYKELMTSGKHEDLVKIIKTTYLRNKERIDNKKKVTDKDISYFKQAEKYLYTEFYVVLGLNYEDTKNYVISKVEGLKH